MTHSLRLLLSAAGIGFLALVLGLAPAQAQQDQYPDRDPDLTYSHDDAQTSKIGKAATTSEVIDALDLSSSQVTTLDFGGSDPVGYTTFSTEASSFPQEGDSYLALSTGEADLALDPNNSGSTSGNLGGPSGPGNATDLVQMEVELNVPDSTGGVAFDFKFLSEEFPEFVGSAFNDGFVVEVGNSTFTVDGNELKAPDNVVFDDNGEPITINTTGALGMSTEGSVGTTYDGGTDVLSTKIPIPDTTSTITLVFSIFDVSDEIYDSALFVDNLRFTDEMSGDGPGTTPVASTCEEQDLSSLPLQISDFDPSQGGGGTPLSKGIDTQEKVEITNEGTEPIGLSGCSMAFFDGITEKSYFAADLSGTVEAGSTYVFGNPMVEDVDQTFPAGTLQDGPDGLGLYKAPASDFPQGTPVTTNLDKRVSTIVYISDETVFGCYNASAPGCGSKTASASGDKPPLLQLGELVESSSTAGVPEKVTLEPPAPNPFRSETTLRYALPEAADVRVAVFDVLGRKVRRLETGRKQAGWHQVELPAGQMSSGNYFVQLTAGGEQETESAIILP